MRAAGPGQSALLLLDVIGVLNALHVPYAIVGAFAASFYGVIRASLDADALISLQPNQADVTPLIDELQKAGLKSTYRTGDSHDPIGAVVNIEDHFRNRVDLLMKIQGMTEAVFSRTIEADFMDARIRVIGVEDFIAMKIFAGGPQDVHDVSGVLRVSYAYINLPLLNTLVQQYGTSAFDTLQSLLRENKPVSS